LTFPQGKHIHKHRRKTHIPGNSSADAPKRTQSPVSKFADLQVEFLLHRSMQSVNIRVPERKKYLLLV
jgi:hypothetical protein